MAQQRQGAIDRGPREWPLYGRLAIADLPRRRETDRVTIARIDAVARVGYLRPAHTPGPIHWRLGMKCPRCQHENPPQAKFCLECGVRVALTCPKCRSELPAGAKFCLECGEPVAPPATVEPRFSSPQTYIPKHLAEKILTSKSALEGERKQVTVLFADLKGSMELLADRDPEEARKILDPVLERMMEAVHRYEGTVNQVMGDGIMALFGAPERRRELHTRIVNAIETLHQERLVEHIEQLAHHAVRGEPREKAVHYLRQAGLKAAARSALLDARGWFEQALAVLEVMPQSQSTLEQAFDIRVDLRPVLTQLDEVRRTMERLHEAGALAERLNDDRRRGRVCALMALIHDLLGELDEALVTGTRALAIARDLGDLELRILTTTYLGQVHYHRGEYKRVVELGTDNLAALPAHRGSESFGLSAPASVYNRSYLVLSLAQLGRFVEAAEYEAEALRLAEPTHHAFTVGMAHRAAGTLHLLKGDWARTRSLIEHSIAVVRTGSPLHLPLVVAYSAWALAQLGDASEALNRLREGEQLVEGQAAGGVVFQHSWSCCSLGRACLLLGLLDEARRLADRAVESSPRQPGFAAHALHLLGDIATHPDRFDAETGEAHYRTALALAEPRGMRPLVAHCYLGLGKLARRTGQRDQAQEHLTTATTMYRDMAMRFWLEQAQAEITQTG